MDPWAGEAKKREYPEKKLETGRRGKPLHIELTL